MAYTLSPLDTAGTSTEETLMAMLQKIGDLRQQPLIPDHPLAQVGAALQGLSSGMQGKPNPAIEFAQKQRQQDLSMLTQTGAIAGTLGSLRREARREQTEKEKMAFDREKFNRNIAVTLTKSSNPLARTSGYRDLIKGGVDFGGATPEQLAEDPTMGFGDTDPGRLAAAKAKVILEQGGTLDAPTRERLLFESNEDLKGSRSIRLYADDIQRMTPGTPRRAAELEAIRQIEEAKRNPNPTVEERVAKLLREGKVVEADRLLGVLKKVAEAKSTKIFMPRPAPPDMVKSTNEVRRAGAALVRLLNDFDPGFVGLVGRTKGFITKFSAFPFIPAFKGREKFIARLKRETNLIKHDLIGSTRSFQEMVDVAQFLPEGDVELSPDQFMAKLEAVTEALISEMHILPGTLKMFDIQAPSLREDIAQLEQGLQRIRSFNDSIGNVISATEYQKLRAAGKTDEEIRQNYVVRGR